MILSKQAVFLRNFWRVVDKATLGAIALLLFTGIILVASSGQVIATRIGVSPLYFASKQLVYLPISILIMISIATLDDKKIQYLGLCGIIFNIILLILVKFYGQEVKGARRWLSLMGISMQPSELIKPFMIITVAWFMNKRQTTDFPGIICSIILYLVIISLLAIQPDFGMIIMISLILFCQFFVSGMPIILIISSIFLVMSLTTISYFAFPHVQNRIDSFLNSEKQNYQVNKSILAFEHGGLYGVGPGEGLVKQVLPDCHTDFIFAVAAEEFGGMSCIIIAAIFSFIIIYNLYKVARQSNHFKVYALAGIISQFGIQAMFNMGVALNLLPTKGITLPLVSYGGSSMIAISISLGVLLALTKRSIDTTKYKELLW
jgi:cell division protein FtsW